MNNQTFALRSIPGPDDPFHIEKIVRSTGFFREDEVLVAVKLVEERLLKGTDSGYEFLFADLGEIPIAYSCYGLIPCTIHSYDLYWIATHKEHMNRGIGRTLLLETEKAIKKAGGSGIYVETSSKEQYSPTRTFYEKNGYSLKASFENFYDQGDDKCVYVKYL